MNGMYKYVSGFLVIWSLGACSVTLPVTGQIGASGESFEGSASGYLGRRTELVVTTSRGVVCHSDFDTVTRQTMSGTLTCDDGRSGPIFLDARDGNRTGNGRLAGQPFTFTVR